MVWRVDVLVIPLLNKWRKKRKKETIKEKNPKKDSEFIKSLIDKWRPRYYVCVLKCLCFLRSHYAGVFFCRAPKRGRAWKGFQRRISLTTQGVCVLSKTDTYGNDRSKNTPTLPDWFLAAVRCPSLMGHALPYLPYPTWTFAKGYRVDTDYLDNGPQAPVFSLGSARKIRTPLTSNYWKKARPNR